MYVDGKAEKINGSYDYITLNGNNTTARPVILFAWSTDHLSSTIGDYRPPCELNDVRIYDNVLSHKEVKEIAKGLRLHYQLKTARFSNVHPGGWGVYNNYNVPGSSLTTTGEYFLGQPVYRLTMAPNTNDSLTSFKNDLWSHGIMTNSCTFAANTAYCSWIYYRPISHSDIRVGGTASNINGWTEISPHYFGDGWYRVGQSRDGSVTTAKSDNIFTSFYTPSATLNTPVVIEFCAPCLVKDRSAIPDNYGDYTLSSTEPDVSGYGLNATITGYVETIGSTPRYKNSYYFGSNAYIKPPAMSFTGMANSYTFAYWARNPDMNGKMAFGFENGNRLNLYPSSWFNWNTGDGDANPFMLNNSNVTFTAYNGGWHHYAITGNGSTTTLYIDGVVRGYAKTYVGITGTQLYISGWDSSNYKWSGGNISDFRIYATCLSAEDIADLAKTAASVSKNGVAFAYDFSEFNPVSASDPASLKSDVVKNGVMFASGLQDRMMPTYDMKIKALEDGSVWARIHSLDVSVNKTVFANASEVAKCLNQPNRYSRMGEVTKFKSQQSLPAGYTELEYIQATGTQYIDTGFIPNQNTGVDIRFSASSYANNAVFVYGGGQDSTARAFELYPWDAQLQYNYGTQYQFIGTPAANSIITSYQRKHIPQSVINNTVTTGNNGAQTFTAPYTLTLFALHRASIIKSGSTGALKIYSCQIYDNEKLVRNFVPCKNASGVAGMYDLVEKRFYGNAGTGSFTAGTFVSKYEFMLTYPTLSTTGYNRWTQTSSPESSTVSGYSPIWLSWPNTSAGLRKSGTDCVYNCDTGSTWYAPIGQTALWISNSTTGIPAANRQSTPVTKTELWVRVDKAAEATKFQIYNNSITATDFVEI
jgi:hypothetical protein